MRTKPLGQSGIEVSAVGLGTWAIGGWMWGGTDEKDSIEAIQAAVDEGITLIDTAAIYGFGVSEELVGKAIRGRRERVVLATKCGLVWHVQKGTKSGEGEGKQIYRYLGPESIRYEVEQSLKRLGTDYIDLYQTHWQDPTTPIEDTMAALMELKDQGKIRAIGVSNATVEDIERYRSVGPLDTDQERYSMLDRQPEQDKLPYCREHNITFLAYSPMAKGLLTGKIGPDRQFSGDDHRAGDPRFSVENRRRIAALLEEFGPVADAHGLTLAQLALAWTAAQPGVIALAGSRNPEQACENARAGDVELTEDELAAIQTAIQKHMSAT